MFSLLRKKNLAIVTSINLLTSESLFHFRPPPKFYQNLNNFDPGRVPVDCIQYFDL